MVVTIGFKDSTFISEDNVRDISYQDDRLSLHLLLYSIEISIEEIDNILITEDTNGN